MFGIFLFVAVSFLAYANGANDNFKGVASLFGSGTTTYRTAIRWATLTTLAGSIAALFLAEALLRKFSGKGLVPDALTASPRFVLAVALGAGATVILATLLGFPISTTHGLTGALTGAGVVAAGAGVNFGVLGKQFLLPLLASPLLALVVGAVVYLLLHAARVRLRIDRETCVCADVGEEGVTAASAGAVALAPSPPRVIVAVAPTSVCARRYAGISAGRLLDALHFLSAGAVGFARGLNDTPKIAALLLTAQALDIRWGLGAVTIAMAAGGLLNAKKVAETMSHKITGMDSGQGFSANLSTAALVTTASLHGLPVSTTHVSVGALLGMGIVTRQAKWKPVVAVLASWVITLPCAAVIAAAAYWGL
jgi:PiT family inorganic phosphate transporter